MIDEDSRKLKQKLVCAREISSYMNPHENRSKSFQIFVQGLREIIKN